MKQKDSAALEEHEPTLSNDRNSNQKIRNMVAGGAASRVDATPIHEWNFLTFVRKWQGLTGARDAAGNAFSRRRDEWRNWQLNPIVASV
jgi:hypothetical protein